MPSPGLYAQRRQEVPAGSSATLSPDDLTGDFFMLRVRIDGRMLTTAQIQALADISEQFARGTADVTDRANLQYHWVRAADAEAIRQRLDAVGLQTTAEPGDCRRVVRESPVAGIAAAEAVDVRNAVSRIRERYLADPTLADLPRKFQTSVSWLADTTPEVNDVAFVGVEHPELGPGFDLLVGGGLSSSPRMAARLGVFVAPAELPEVWHAVVTLFRDHGLRHLGRRARMKYLVDAWGGERFREVLETAYLHRPLPDGPAAPVPDRAVDHVGVHAQRDGRHYVGFSTVAGRLSGPVLAEIADAVQEAGSDRLRFTTHQKVLVFDVDPARVGALVDRMDALGLPADPSPWRRSVMACTGREFCRLGVVETKQRAVDLVEELERRLGHLGLDQPISIHLNGCPNSCARVQIADIGLKGRVVTRGGVYAEGFQVQLGGGLGADAGPGRRVRSFDVASDELGDYVERLVLRYLDSRAEGEPFAQWAQRADESLLR